MSIYERLDNELAAKDDRIAKLERDNAALQARVAGHERTQEPLAIRAEKAEAGLAALQEKLTIALAEGMRLRAAHATERDQAIHAERDNAALRAEKARLWLALERYRSVPDKYGKDTATEALGGAQ